MIGGNEKAQIDSSGRLLVGTSSSLRSAGIIQVAGSSYPAVDVFSFGTTTNPEFVLSQARGSQASPTVISSGDSLGKVLFRGYDGDEFHVGAIISAEADAAVSNNDLPTRLVFSTTADGASSPTERMRIDSVGRVRPSITTLASYIYTNWNPSDVVGTVTNAPNTGTTSDSEFVTLANSSGTLTITFDIAGKYLVGTRAQTNHSNNYTRDRLVLTFGGTASALPPTAQNSGDSVNDLDFAIGNSYSVSATAGQTCTVLPTYECVGAGVVGNHTALCGITVLYCGG